MTEDQRFEFVLGPKCSGYIHGRGAGTKPMTSSLHKQINKKLEQENEELKRKAEEDRKAISEMGSRLEYLESQVASQQTSMNDQVQVVIQSQLVIILQQFKEFGH